MPDTGRKPADVTSIRPSSETNRETSPEAILFFLKQAALDPEWTAADIAGALAINPDTAKEVAAELTLMGYADPIPGKEDAWRNTEAGNKVAGVRTPRLTRKTADDLLADVADRAVGVNLEDRYSVCITKIVAFGGITTKHDRIQDIDIGVQLEPKLGRTATESDEEAILKALKGSSPSLKTHPLKGWLLNIPGRLVWEG
jgi:hypothetical protein